jgi:anti-anti-sigma regulatory factor
VNIETISAEVPTRVRLNGDLTFSTIREVHDAVCVAHSTAAGEKVVVDLEGVEGIDLTALQWIVACRSLATFVGEATLARLTKMAHFAGINLEEAMHADE